MRCGRWVQLRARSFCFRRTITGIDLDDQASRFYVDKAAATTLDEDAQVGGCCALFGVRHRMVTAVDAVCV